MSDHHDADSGDLMNLWLANLARAWRYLVLHGHWCRHPEMGSWWPCNLGADEVRMCPACDRIEKRAYEDES